MISILVSLATLAAGLTTLAPPASAALTFGAATNFAVGSLPHSIAIGDLNGDAEPDLAVANQDSDNVSVLLGTGTGSFGAATNFAAGEGSMSVAIGDLDGDTVLDLAVANAGSSDVSVFLGDGTGSFGAATNFAVGGRAVSVAIGDLDGDTVPDLAVANSGSSDVSVLLGDGSGSFGAATNFAVGTEPVSVAIGDLDGDSVPDLAVANASSWDLSVLLGTGSGSFGAATNFAVGNTPFSVAIGDLNGDTVPDLAGANVNSDDVSVLLGDGFGTFGAATNYAAGDGSYSVAIGDLNGDTASDLAVANVLSGDVSVLTSIEDNTEPTVTVEQAAGQADPTDTLPFHFTAEFSEKINEATFDNTDVFLASTSYAGPVTVTITSLGDGRSFDIALAGLISDGMLIVSIGAGRVSDLAGNTNTESTSLDNTVTYVAPVDAAASTLTPTSASITADGSATQLLTVTAKYANGNNVGTGGATVEITKQSGTGTLSAVTDVGDGTYTATVTAPTSSGSGVFVATIGGSPVRSGTASQTTSTITYAGCPTKLTFALTEVTATEGCLAQDPGDPLRYTTSDPVRVNGIPLTPSAANPLVITLPPTDATGGTLTLLQSQSISVGELTVPVPSIDWDLPAGGQGERGIVAELSLPDPEDLFGLEVGGSVAMKFGFGEDGSHYATFSLNIQLPTIFKSGPDKESGGVTGTGAVKLVSDPEGGEATLKFDGLKLEVQNVWLGKLKVESACFSYSPDGGEVEPCDLPELDGEPYLSDCDENATGDHWDGNAIVILPTKEEPSLAAFGGVTNGQLSKLGGFVDNLGRTLPLASGVYLTRVGIGFCVGPPLQVRGDVGVSVFPLEGSKSVLTVNGSILYRDPYGTDPWSVTLGGSVAAFGTQIGKGSLTVRPTGSLDFALTMGTNLVRVQGSEGCSPSATCKYLISIEGGVSGWIETSTNRFNVQGSVTGCLSVLCARADALVSSTGLAGCIDAGTLVWWELRATGTWVWWNPATWTTTWVRHETPLKAGFGYRWNAASADVFGGSCNLGAYAAVRTASALSASVRSMALVAQSGGGSSINVVSGTPALALRILGTDGVPPAVTITDPDGAQVITPATPANGESGAESPADCGGPGGSPCDWMLVQNPSDGTTNVLLVDPTAGTWQVEGSDGNPVTQVEEAGFEPPAAGVGGGVVRQPDGRQTVSLAYTLPQGSTISLFERSEPILTPPEPPLDPNSDPDGTEPDPDGTYGYQVNHELTDSLASDSCSALPESDELPPPSDDPSDDVDGTGGDDVGLLLCASLTFEPLPGPGGTRSVVAVVSRDGIPQETIPVGTFEADAWTLPENVSPLQLQRDGRNVLLAWDTEASPESFAVSVEISDGRKLAFNPAGSCRALLIPDVGSQDLAVDAGITGIRADLETGPAATLTLPAGQTYAGPGTGPITQGPMCGADVGDTTGPTASPRLSSSANADGWHNSAFTIYWDWAEEDGGSGIDPSDCTSSTDVGDDGVYSLSAKCKDLLGNVGRASVDIKLDTKAPTITASATKADHTAYFAGTWTDQTVTVHFTCSDTGGSGVATCPSDQVFDADGVTDSVGGEATDNVGNSAIATFGPVKIDKTAPTITITSPGATFYALGQVVAANYTCQDAAGGSSIASCNGTVANGVGIDTALVGVKTFRVDATDGAGNSFSKSVNYVVGYGFGVFKAPLPRSTLSKSGSTISVKFTLKGSSGALSSTESASLAANNQVRALLSGPGTTGPIAVSALCTWSTANLHFQCNIKTPKGLLTGTRNTYQISAQVTLTVNGTSFFNAPGTGNPLTISFK